MYGVRCAVHLADDTDYITVNGNGGTAAGADAGRRVLLDDQVDDGTVTSAHSQLYDVPYEATETSA